MLKPSRVLSQAIGLLSAGIVTSASRAQLEPTELTILTDGWSGQFTCAPTEQPCDGETSRPVLGKYQFSVFAGPEGVEVRECWFAFRWPEDWILLDAHACQDTLLSGDPAFPDAGFHFRSADCFDYTIPVLQLAFDCTTPGRMSIVDLPDHDSGALFCVENWSGLGAYPYAEIGDYCGAVPQDPCILCLNSPAGRFEPRTLEASVPLGSTAVDTIVAHSWELCEQIEECYPDPMVCFMSVSETEPWMELRRLGDNEAAFPRVTYRYEVTFDGKEEGVFTGRLWLGGNSSCCISVCTEVTLTVLPAVSTIQRSWGRIRIRE